MKVGRKPKYKNSPNLVSTFKEVATRDGVILSEVLTEMNRELGSNYSHSNLSAMERGERKPRPELVNYMLRKVVPVLLAEAGVAPKIAHRILEKLLISVGY